jgi:hypothetical protein
MSKDQKRGNREAKKPKTIKAILGDPAAGKTALASPPSVKVKH